jgi:hypothetical protein
MPPNLTQLLEQNTLLSLARVSNTDLQVKQFFCILLARLTPRFDLLSNGFAAKPSRICKSS